MESAHCAPVNIEIINTGSELMLGRVLNTHQQWLCREMADRGRTVARQTAVPDTAQDIVEAVKEALGRADLILVTGGLGPTSDDRTRDLIAQLLGRKLEMDPAIVEKIRGMFARRRRTPPPGMEVQAMVPEGAIVLSNDFGTAPGLALKVEAGRYRASASWLVMLPGPPRELKPMFLHQAVPLLERELPQMQEFACRTLKTTGIGESWVEEQIASRLEHLTKNGLDLGYCARVGEVDVRFVAQGLGAAKMVRDAEEIVRSVLAEHVYGTDDEQLEQVVIRLLTQKNLKVALAESCTGGFIANRLTNVPGASAAFLAGLVTYSNEAKQKFLGVQLETLVAHGAVSEATAREMAAGARANAGADYAIAVTGIAGPGGGSEEKPVGTVFIALAAPHGTEVKRQLNTFDRETFKYVTSQQGLEMLRRALLK
ncbi:MAG TPA: competence/damage-inducible protein A [Candidatus Saccharimonadales bacterium]|nr:competence/damage-inducible protein A [Candidatus Saccharimonadales bacterium]